MFQRFLSEPFDTDWTDNRLKAYQELRMFIRVGGFVVHVHIDTRS